MKKLNKNSIMLLMKTSPFKLLVLYINKSLGHKSIIFFNECFILFQKQKPCQKKTLYTNGTFILSKIHS